MTAHPTQATEDLRAARDFLLEHREDYADARSRSSGGRGRAPSTGVSSGSTSSPTERPDQPALVIVEEDGASRSWTYAELSARSDQVAGWLAANGVQRGDRIVLMLGNQVELWEIVLAAIKLGAVIIPASTLLTPADLADRVLRGGARFVVARDVDAESFRRGAGHLPADRGRPAGRGLDRVRRHRELTRPADFVPDGVSPAARPAAAVLHLRHHRAAQTG